MTTGGYLRLLARNRFRIHPIRWAMATIIFFVSIITTFLALIQQAVWGRKIARTEFERPPIFVVGHWRSGTTLLHELLSLDQQHAFPSTYECFAPQHFILTGKIAPKLLWWTVPNSRPMDAMPIGFDAPQEDEFALVSMGAPSTYYRMAFCNDPPPFEEFYAVKDVDPADLRRFDRSLIYFFKALTLHKQKRLILKSPTHTGRVEHLAKLFPGAKFIHISRNPSKQILSIMRTWKSLDPSQGFQFPKYTDEELLSYVLRTFRRMYDGFFSQFDHIPETDRVELRFEDLVSNPAAEVRRIYETLGLADFDSLEPLIQDYFAERTDYQRRRYEIDPEVDARIRENCADYMQRYGYVDA